MSEGASSRWAVILNNSSAGLILTSEETQVIGEERRRVGRYKSGQHQPALPLQIRVQFIISTP